MFVFTYIFAVTLPFSYVFCSRLFVCHRWLAGLRNLLGGCHRVGYFFKQLQ